MKKTMKKPGGCRQQTCVWIGLMATTALAGMAQAQEIIHLDPIYVEGEGLESDGEVEGYVANTSSAATIGGMSRVETPVSVSVVGADQIEDQGATSLVEALRYTAGVFGEYRGTSNLSDEIVLRGFGDRAFVPKTLDGLSFGSGGQIDPYYFSRVEVVKGPNSVVSGQSTPGGMVAMSSKQPTQEQGNELQFEFGSDDYRRVNGDIQGDLSEDGSLSYRLVTSAWQKNLQEEFDQSRYLFAPTLRWELSEDTTLTFKALYQDEPEAGQRGFMPKGGTLIQTSNGIWIDEDFQSYAPDYDYVERTTKSLGYELDHTFGNGWTLKHSLNWSQIDMDQSQVGLWTSSSDSAGNYDLYVFREASERESLTGKAALSGTVMTGALEHDIAVGMDVLKRKTTGTYDRSGVVFTYNFADGTSPTLAEIEAIALDASNSVTDTELTQTGLFVQDHVSYGNWDFLAGLRYDWTETSAEETYDAEALTGRLGVSYGFGNGLTTYLSYSTSFEPVTDTDDDGNVYDPTTARQWELGAKWQSVDGRMFVSAALFDIQKKNILESYTEEGETYTDQIGSVRSKGVEIEAQAEVNERLSLIAAYGYNDGYYETGENKGNNFYAVPDQNASLWVKYGLTDAIDTSFGIRYVGSSWNSSSNDFKVPSYTLFDAGVSADMGKLIPSAQGVKAKLSVQNLTDERYVTSCVREYCWLGEGRNWAATLTYEW